MNLIISYSVQVLYYDNQRRIHWQFIETNFVKHSSMIKLIQLKHLVKTPIACLKYNVLQDMNGNSMIESLAEVPMPRILTQWLLHSH